MLTVAVVEDELRERKKIVEYLEKYSRDNNVEIRAHPFSNGLDFLDSLKKSVYDIVLLDIEMPHIDGMQVARKMREQDPGAVLIFVTNMVSYAVEGYDVNALAFMVKPVSYVAFAFNFEKAVYIHERDTRGKSVLLTSGRAIQRVAVSEITYIESIKHSIFYHTDRGDFPIWNRTMNEIEEEMEQYGFGRCNSCYIVNLNRVKKICGDMIVMDSGDDITISRGRKKKFIEKLALWGGS